MIVLGAKENQRDSVEVATANILSAPACIASALKEWGFVAQIVDATKLVWKNVKIKRRCL
tara:strand:- start:80 stop:259 length:180 start_codon:yes stop_codon:yes gene_type:complete